MAMETTAEALAHCNPANLPVALSDARLNLEAILAAIGTPVTETLACGATFKFQLTKCPMPGSIIMARKTGSYLKQSEVHPLCTLGASDFSVDYDTGIVTAEATDFNDTNEAVFIYTGLPFDSTGIAGTALAEELAADFARAS